MSRKITAFLLAMLMLPLSAMNTLADENDPDLSINEISFSDDSPTGGDEITITAVVANDGGTSGLITVTTNVSFYYDGNFIAKETITIPGDTSGTWNSNGLRIAWNLASAGNRWASNVGNWFGDSTVRYGTNNQVNFMSNTSYTFNLTLSLIHI